MNKCENCQRYNSGTCSKDLNKKECNYIEIKSTLEPMVDLEKKSKDLDISKLPCANCEWRYSLFCPRCEWNKNGKVKVY